MSITIVDDYGTTMPSVEYVKNNYSVTEVERSLSKYKAWLFVASIASFLTSAMSVVKYMAGGTLIPTLWTPEQALAAMTGLMLVAIVVAGETFAFSSGYRGRVMIAITAFFIFFGLFTEITQAMERENEGVSIRSQQQPTYQAAIRSIDAISNQANRPIDNPYMASIAAQAQVVARCKRRITEGKEKHCDGDTAKLEALRNQSQAALSAAAQGSSASIMAALNTAKEWERDEAQHYGMIKLLKSWFNIEAMTATFIFSFIIIATFRVAFLWVGDQVATYKQALEHMTGGTRMRTGTQVTAFQDTKPAVSDTLRDMRYAKPEVKPVKNYEPVPLAEIVRLSSIVLLCDIADEKLESFSVRTVSDALKRNGFGTSNDHRANAIYPELVDHFEKEGYISLNEEWDEPEEGQPNKNGTRPKWVLNVAYCKRKAESISRG